MTGKPSLMLCDCTGTFTPDARAIEAGTGLTCPKIHTHLCRAEAAQAAAVLKEGPTIIACLQEQVAFDELAADLDVEAPLTVDIRDRAGWSGDPSGAKQAALIADALLPAPPVPVMDVTSEGVCLIYGRGEQVLAAGARLADSLAVTVMLTEPTDAMPPDAEMDVVTGRITRASGALGNFSIKADGFAELLPAGRGARRFDSPRNAAATVCDLIVDLSGGQALFPAADKRDGYLRADPGDPLAVERLLFDAAQMTGTFEKTLFIRFEESLCAHSRAGQTACTRCLDLCPTSAISPAGDHVAIDPNICAGCGACAAACPSGAVSAEDPTVQHLFNRMRAMADAYRKAGGSNPRLLVHDSHGAEMIRLGARYGDGLPGDVIPLEVTSLNAFGHAEQVTALALGFCDVAILTGPHTEIAPLTSQIELALAMGGDNMRATGGAAAGDGPATPRIRLVQETDPDAMLAGLAARPEPLDIQPILPLGGRREAARLAARALAGPDIEAPLPLPAGAPYGTVIVDTGACTLCLACAGLCPPGALGDNPDAPELNFREEACLQCGLCVNVCPENAITLVPRMDLSDQAMRQCVLNAEEPFACIECGSLFGVKSTIEKITEKLSSHSMFTNSDNVKLIQMCDDCRVAAQYHSDAAPFQGGDRPRVRTTQDYLDERED